jgi:hypothetical protein
MDDNVFARVVHAIHPCAQQLSDTMRLRVTGRQDAANRTEADQMYVGPQSMYQSIHAGYINVIAFRPSASGVLMPPLRTWLGVAERLDPHMRVCGLHGALPVTHRPSAPPACPRHPPSC